MFNYALYYDALGRFVVCDMNHKFISGDDSMYSEGPYIQQCYSKATTVDDAESEAKELAQLYSRKFENKDFPYDNPDNGKTFKELAGA